MILGILIGATAVVVLLGLLIWLVPATDQYPTADDWRDKAQGYEHMWRQTQRRLDSANVHYRLAQGSANHWFSRFRETQRKLDDAQTSERYSIRYRGSAESLRANHGRAWKAIVDGNKARYFHTEQEAQAWIGRRAMAMPRPTQEPEMAFDHEGNLL